MLVYFTLMTTPSQPNNPLHGVTLKALLTKLVDRYGWEELGDLVRIRCFTDNPSIHSSLVFLRKTPWAREKVEDLYLRCDRGPWKKPRKKREPKGKDSSTS